ncbi:ATP-binding protein [Paucibacter sp. O1-1]|nr:ATP-binding protein [Paucibacter sp. O1-1]MDA3830120.1 ATP-binding protein [Paucibacter sp. O1-1]
MPSVLSDFGLASALRLLGEQTADSSGINIEFEGDSSQRIEMSRPMEIGLYRIAQEALNNAVKHANADMIKIKLEQNKNRIVLEISDDGKGFLISNLKSEEGFSLNRNGMENIRTRSQLLNGKMEIVSKVDSGTKLSITVNL